MWELVLLYNRRFKPGIVAFLDGLVHGDAGKSAAEYVLGDLLITLAEQLLVKDYV
jgi:hypothetical protein